MLVAEGSKRPVRNRYFDQKVEAAHRTLAALEAVKARKLELGGPIDSERDPRETGLIGQGLTAITTDRGWLDQKQRALDPNIAAAFVDLLRQAGVRRGDLVAVGVTGAFPLLNAAMIVAIETVGARAVVISSVGASQWGANDPDFTWLDIERLLVEDGVIPCRSVAASIGGSRDRGGGLEPEGRRFIMEAIERNGVELIHEETLDASIERRMAIYDGEAADSGYTAYVNIGGGLASIGGTQIRKVVKGGLSRNLSRDLDVSNLSVRSVAILMDQRGVPIIHVPSADELVERYALPWLSDESASVPDVGHGQVFYQDRYNVPLAAVLAALYAFAVFVVVRLDIKHYLFRRASGDRGA